MIAWLLARVTCPHCGRARTETMSAGPDRETVPPLDPSIVCLTTLVASMAASHLALARIPTGLGTEAGSKRHGTNE